MLNKTEFFKIDMKTSALMIMLLFFSCQNGKDNEIHNQQKNKETEAIPNIEKDIFSFEEFEKFKQNKRLLFHSAFWAGMTKENVVKSLNFLLDKREIFIDSTSLFKKYQNNEFAINKFKKHLVYHNYIEYSEWQGDFFEDDDDYQLFTFFLSTKKNQYKVYIDFMFSPNPLNKNIEELEQITLYIFNANKYDFDNVVETYKEKYGLPINKEKINKKNKSTTESSFISSLIEDPLFEENFHSNGINISLDMRDQDITKPFNVDRFSKYISIYYRDKIYSDAIEKENNRINNIQKEIESKKENENEMQRKQKVNEQI